MAHRCPKTALINETIASTSTMVQYGLWYIRDTPIRQPSHSLSRKPQVGPSWMASPRLHRKRLSTLAHTSPPCPLRHWSPTTCTRIDHETQENWSRYMFCAGHNCIYDAQHLSGTIRLRFIRLDSLWSEPCSLQAASSEIDVRQTSNLIRLLSIFLFYDPTTCSSLHHQNPYY